MNSCARSLGLLVLSCLFLSCSTTNQTTLQTNLGNSASIQNMDCCDDFRQQVMQLEREKEIVILVHGCLSSSGQFETLKTIFESRGQQAICFSYDYRESIEKCSGQLLKAINFVNEILNPSQITVLGHSQGGLVARRALIQGRTDGLHLDQSLQKIRLVTVSSPFNGIKASAHCGSLALHLVSVGTTMLICQAIAGSTWGEINPESDFIRSPGIISEKVYSHLKINTDETDSCRTLDAQGNCVEDDFVFGLDEQYTQAVDQDARVVNRDIKAGHAQVIGKAGAPPLALIGVLEEHKVLLPPVSTAQDLLLLQGLYSEP